MAINILMRHFIYLEFEFQNNWLLSLCNKNDNVGIIIKSMTTKKNKYALLDKNDGD